jgi:radical SAM protein with 4Fe4S-binding SPASM domain
MNYYLSRRAALKWLETPSVYHLGHDELYELDKDSFRFLKTCASPSGGATKNRAFIDYCMEEGLLTTENYATGRSPLAQAPQPSLRYLELQITDACNLRCRHCYLDGAGNELSPERVKKVLSEFEEMQGLRALITGGEPLLHRNFGEINELLADFSVRKVLFTNGLLITKDNLRTLKVEELQVSIDGLEAAHDKVRGNGTFRPAMEAVKRALAAGFDVSISTMIHLGNLADFDGMDRLFKSMEIKDWTVDVPCPIGRLKENAAFSVTPEQGGKYLGYGYGGGIHASAQGYGCGLHLMAVLADGKIAKCTFYGDHPLGAVDEGLRAAWSRAQPIRLSELACHCEYLELCRGGCRARAELLEGTGGKDLYRCALYGII